MNEQEEYNKFLIKFIKTVIDVQQDFNNLSEANKIRFANEAQQALRASNMSIGVEQLRRLLEQKHFG
jgi:hypothetical protein